MAPQGTARRSSWLKRDDGIPFYVVLQERIVALIAEQRLSPGDVLPSETELQSRFGVSRSTVRQALGALERRGVVERRQGSGTFLRVPAMERSLPELTGFSEHIVAHGMRPSSTLVAFDQVPRPAEGDGRHFPPATRLVRAVRLRHANDVAVGIHTVYVPLDVAERVGFSAQCLRDDRSVSLYALIRAAGIEIAWGEEHLQARGATTAEAHLLGTGPGTPVMSVLRLTRDQGDRLIEVVRAVYLGDKYDYIVHLERGATGAPCGGVISPAQATPEEDDR